MGSEPGTRPWPNLLFLLPFCFSFLLKFSTYFAFYCTHFAFNYTHFASHDEVMLHKFAAPIPSAILVDLSSCCSHFAQNFASKFGQGLSGTHVIQTSSSLSNVAWVLAPAIITPTAQCSVIMQRDCHNSSCPDHTFNSNIYIYIYSTAVYIGWESNEDTVLDSETVQDCTVANSCNLVTKQSDSLTSIYTEKMSILPQLLLHYATVTCQLIFSCILKRNVAWYQLTQLVH